MATIAPARAGLLSFWQKMSLGISAFIVFGFAQFALRGFANYGKAPAIVHVHGGVMLAWLGLLCAQSLLVGRGNLALHRKLGWVSVILLPLVVALASLTCLGALRAGAQPPFFTPAYFLALVHVGALVFAALAALALARRRQPEWHRRLMVGSTILLMEPALGRLLPMPLIMPWGGWAVLAVQLGAALLMVAHDRRAIGRLHPATVAVVLSLVFTHALIELLAVTPAWQALAASLAAG